MTKMTTEEAFVKVLQMHGIENAFGIIGSAFMPVSDLFPKAGITFWDVAHESNGGLIADGYTRATGKIAMCIAQNGPGVTGLVTPIKTAYWNHTPMLLVTPQAANKTMGQGGFQEVEQMNLFKDMVCYQEEVRDPSRMAEVLNRVIEKAIRGSAPSQINVPRDYWTQVVDIELPPIVRLEKQAGGASAVTEAAKLLSNAKFLKSNIDFFYLDVMGSGKECEIALKTIKSFNLPVLIGVHIRKNGKLPSGENISDIVKKHKEENWLGIIAACVHPESYEIITKEMKNLNIPYGFKLNAFKNIPDDYAAREPSIWGKGGNPTKILGSREDITESKFYEFVKKFKDDGATILGGCCEIRPSHISKIANLKN